ncbi:MAG: hypothetical protein ABL958_09350, partial [Bdellovibrionia bacterium]
MRWPLGLLLCLVLTSVTASAGDLYFGTYSGPSTFTNQLFKTSTILPQVGCSSIPNYFGPPMAIGLNQCGPYSFVPTPPWYSMPGSYEFGMSMGMRYGIHGPGLLPAGSATAAWIQQKYGGNRQNCAVCRSGRSRRTRSTDVDRDPLAPETPPVDTKKPEPPPAPEPPAPPIPPPAPQPPGPAPQPPAPQVPPP